MLASPADPLAPLRAALRAYYGFQQIVVDPAPLGYSNRSHLVRADGIDAVVRISHAGKPAAQVAREERLLGYLAARPGPPVPRILRTRRGRPHFLLGGRRHHLFLRLPGAVRYRWKDLPAAADLLGAVAALAALHEALEPLPIPRPAPFSAWARALRTVADQRLERALASHPLWPAARPLLPAFMRAAGALLRAARALPLRQMTAHYVQGDFQLENLLFLGHEVSGVLDFDNAHASLRELDLVFALLCLARDGHRDERFTYRRDLYEAGLRGYRAAAARRGLRLCEAALVPSLLPLWEGLFCLDQCLLHLRCASRGQWRLERGIGFWACYRALLDGWG